MTRPANQKLVYSAKVGNNDKVFLDLMHLHVPKGAVVADVTYGKGVFWKLIPEGEYDLRATDISTGVDCRSLPYDTESIDCVVFDPPYIGGFFRSKVEQLAFPQQPFQERYCHGETPAGSHVSHRGVMALYAEGAEEAFRVLKPKGVYVVKCQDEVEDHIQQLTHVDLILALRAIGFHCRDLFVLVRPTNPHGRRIKKQRHARKNHSYFLVFVKVKDAAGNCYSPRA